MIKPALRIVETVRGKGATWFAANADGCITLAVGGLAMCEVTPVAIGADGVVLTWQASCLRIWRVSIAGPGPLAAVSEAAAKWFGVPAPAADFLAGFTDRTLFPTVPESPIDTAALLERFADVLALILDEPLHTLPGAGPDGGSPLALRLSHFLPDIADRAAALLEEMGR
ncbi:hypothetical protein [Methylobacterium sp. WL120]|uniref:hypothetical protein n=1 Tax=Methylobacterium sp. WL120 TaxID=2603887 RepID=UPI0011CAE380|nr:hypothetical protein [Methylobacterium sp. WL120]TXM65849.1 hypothetical protein FV229_14345 [Methylobacterium sp. WL120]